LHDVRHAAGGGDGDDERRDERLDHQFPDLASILGDITHAR
jgi:hypothetical protein